MAPGISSITLFEITQFAERGRVKLNIFAESFLRAVEQTFVVLSINAEVAYWSGKFPQTHPRDRADRLIEATALIEGVPLITTDQLIRKCNRVSTIS